MLQMWYIHSQGVHALFSKHTKGGNVTILLVYVDYIVVIGNDETEKDGLRICLAHEFEIKELENWNTSLGLRLLALNKESLFPKQSLDLFKKIGSLLQISKSPYWKDHKLDKEERKQCYE